MSNLARLANDNDQEASSDIITTNLSKLSKNGLVVHELNQL